MGTIIETRQLTKTYQPQLGPVLKGIDMSVEEGEFIAIMGRSGCGKTTFLKILGLIDEPSTGQVLFKNQDTRELLEEEIADIRRKDMGFVFQDYNLMDSLTVGENIMLPAILDKRKRQERRERMHMLAEKFALEKMTDKYPYELSGGEKQRAALCRALMNNPELLFADEPTGNLDSEMGAEVIGWMERLNKEWNKTVIIVTHDLKIAKRCKKVIKMQDGALDI